MDGADLVGWIVGERGDGAYIYACDHHAGQAYKDEPHRQVLREEAAESAATCGDCGIELAEAPAA